MPRRRECERRETYTDARGLCVVRIDAGGHIGWGEKVKTGDLLGGFIMRRERVLNMPKGYSSLIGLQLTMQRSDAWHGKMNVQRISYHAREGRTERGSSILAREMGIRPPSWFSWKRQRKRNSHLIASPSFGDFCIIDSCIIIRTFTFRLYTGDKMRNKISFRVMTTTVWYRAGRTICGGGLNVVKYHQSCFLSLPRGPSFYHQNSFLLGIVVESRVSEALTFWRIYILVDEWVCAKIVVLLI